MDDFQIDGIRQDVTVSLKIAVRYSIPLDPRWFRWQMLILSGPNARVLLQLLIPLVTWSVVNVTAEVKYFRLISLDTNRVSRKRDVSAQLWSGELSIEVVGDLLWRGYLRAVKCDCLVLSLGRRSTIYCLDSSPQFCRIGLVIQRLHKLSSLLSFMFICCSGNLIVHLWQGGRGWISWSEIISCSHLSQYLCWNWLCVD